MEDKIKLEEELEFLKESFEAEVINKGEYEKAKARIEDKLRTIEAKEKIEEDIKKEGKQTKGVKEEPKQGKAEEKKEEIRPEVKEEEKEEVKEEKPEIKAEKEAEEKKPAIKEIITEKEVEKKEEPKIEIKEIKEPSRFKEPEEETKKEEKREEIKKEELKEVEKVDEKEEDTNDIFNSKKEFKVEGEKKKISIWMIAAIIFLIVIGYFSFSFFTNKEPIEESIGAIVSICFSDTDCVKEGMIGFCNNPGSEEAECEFKEAVQVNFIVLNTKKCFNCDTSRVEKIIKGWFPGTIKEEIEFDSEEGKSLVKNLSIELLPAYIFDSSLEETFRFKNNEIVRGVFSEVNDKYILSQSASGSTFYVNKEEIPNRLDIFLLKDHQSTEKAEENMEEFLDLFNNKIDYNKYLVNKEDNLIKALGINTFPTFLVNNKIRFSGVQPSETIKENFCKLNELKECNEKLTESLV